MKLKSNYQSRPHILIAVGLLGITLYQFIMRLNHPAFMDKDFFHGLWLGCFLGIHGGHLWRGRDLMTGLKSAKVIIHHPVGQMVEMVSMMLTMS